MILKPWESLPEEMKLPEVRPYYDLLQKKKGSLLLKRGFDIAFSAALLVLFSPLFGGLSLAIKLDSPGPVFYRQERVTRYGKRFRIHKFRSMVDGADKKGSLVTIGGDPRVTKVGRVIRKYRLDEISQLLDVFVGDMSFVGTRPEVPKYVACYSPEMMATLLLPAGVTSEASIRYKDEAELLDTAENVDRVYVEQVLPGKMKYNLDSIRQFSLSGDLFTMIKTVAAVLGMEFQ